MANALHLDATLISVYFSITSLTAPISGVIVGGIVVSLCGGYNTVRA
jgi:hypothetical protein